MNDNGHFEPHILAFLCNWCTYTGADLAGTSRLQYPPNVRVIRTMCSGAVDPVYVLFEDFTHVKFYRRSFFDVVEEEEGPFEGFVHVDDWVPQKLVTATGSNPLPR